MDETGSVAPVMDSLDEAWQRARAGDPEVSAALDLQAACRDAADLARAEPEAAGVIAPRLLDVLELSWQPDATASALWGGRASLQNARNKALEALRSLDAGALVDALASPDAEWTIETAVDTVLAATSADDDLDMVRWTLELLESLAWVAPRRVGERGGAIVDRVAATFDGDAERRRLVSLRVLLLVTRSAGTVPDAASTVRPSLLRILQAGGNPSKLLAATVADTLDLDLPSSLSEWATADDRHISVVLSEHTRLSLDALLADLEALGYAAATTSLASKESLATPIQRTTHRDRPSVAETIGARFVLDTFDLGPLVEQDGDDFLCMAALVGHAVSLDEFPDNDAQALFASRVRTQAPRDRFGAAVALGVLAKADSDAEMRAPLRACLTTIVREHSGYRQSVAADALGFLVAADVATPLTAFIETGSELTRLHAAGALGLLVAADSDEGDTVAANEIDALAERIAAKYTPEVRTADHAALLGVEAEALGFALAAREAAGNGCAEISTDTDVVTTLRQAVLAAPDDYRQRYAVATGIAHAVTADTDEDAAERLATAVRTATGAERDQLALTLGHVVIESSLPVDDPVVELILERSTTASELTTDADRSPTEFHAVATVLGEVAADRLASSTPLIPLAEAVYRSRGRPRQRRAFVRDAVLARLDDTDPMTVLESLGHQPRQYSKIARGLLETVDRYCKDDVKADSIDRLTTISRFSREDAVVGAATEVLEAATARDLAAPAALEPGEITGDAEPAAAARAFAHEPAAKQATLLRTYRAISVETPERIRGYVPMLREFAVSDAPDPVQRLDAVAVLSNVSQTANGTAAQRGDSPP